MAKLYKANGMLLGEELPAKISLKEWVEDAHQTQMEPKAIFKFLCEAGRYFTKILEMPPEGVLRPHRIQAYQCHSNNILYGAVLAEMQPEVLCDFSFVSGFYGMKAIDDDVPTDKKYFIGNHTFMTYKGAVLDYTSLQHPPNAYKPDQYFGVAFDVKIMVNAFNVLFKKDNNIIPQIPVLEVLRNEPYLKE